MKKTIEFVLGAALLVVPAVSFGQSQSPQDRPPAKDANKTTQKGASQANQKGGDQAHANGQNSGNSNNSAKSTANNGKGTKDKAQKGKSGKQPPSVVESDPTVPNSPGIK